MNAKWRARAAWCAALILLCGVMIAVNLPGTAQRETALSETPSADFSEDVPAGHEPGERLPDFTITQTDGRAFSLSAQRGKVVVLNLWATWCTPCVNELPHFDRLQREHGGDVSVLAIHSDLITDDVEAYLSNYEYEIAFAIDGTGGVIASLGGSTMLPQTVILNPDGVVTYNKVGSVTYEALEELYEAARNGAKP